MMGAHPALAPAALSADSWEVMFQQTLRFAAYQVNRLRWRGDTDGILPDGYDANSIAAQAILEFLEQRPFVPENGGVISIPGPARAAASRLVAPTCPATAFERRRKSDEDGLGSSGQDPGSWPLIQHELNRLVLKHVTRLYHRKENFILRNAEDLAPILDLDDELVSVLCQQALKTSHPSALQNQPL